jgi:Bacterial regulatory proteins, tetR family
VPEADKIARTRGRPPRKDATAYTAIMDAVYGLLQERSVRDLTMEAVAKRAKVGKPTLYKWWLTKAALVLGFEEICNRAKNRPPRKSIRIGASLLSLNIVHPIPSGRIRRG